MGIILLIDFCYDNDAYYIIVPKFHSRSAIYNTLIDIMNTIYIYIYNLLDLLDCLEVIQFHSNIYT